MSTGEERTYLVVPQEVAGIGVLKCSQCDRVLRAGYPFVPVRRDVVHPEPLHLGQPMLDAVCVYCDPEPSLPFSD